MSGNSASGGMCGEPLLLKNQLCFPIYACAREIIKAYHEPLSALNLTYTQYLVMMVLWEEKQKSVRALGECLYLDSGMAEARRFIMQNVLNDVEFGDSHRGGDYKTQLQELVQRKSNQIITYRLVEESGPDHDKTFTFEVLINGAVSGRGKGKTKKEAEQMAACKALENVQE